MVSQAKLPLHPCESLSQSMQAGGPGDCAAGGAAFPVHHCCAGGQRPGGYPAGSQHQVRRPAQESRCCRTRLRNAPSLTAGHSTCLVMHCLLHRVVVGQSRLPLPACLGACAARRPQCSSRPSGVQREMYCAGEMTTVRCTTTWSSPCGVRRCSGTTCPSTQPGKLVIFFLFCRLNTACMCLYSTISQRSAAVSAAGAVSCTH